MNLLTPNWSLILAIIVLACFVWWSFLRGRSSRAAHVNGGLNPGWQKVTAKDEAQSSRQKSEHKRGGCC